jgi:hypothetical protein
MKTLKDYLRECEMATPMNTAGIGNIACPDASEVGSGDLIGIADKDIKKKKKKLKKKKNIRNLYYENNR